MQFQITILRLYYKDWQNLFQTFCWSHTGR